MISLSETDRMLFAWINRGWSDPVLDAATPLLSVLADSSILPLWLALMGLILGLRLARSDGKAPAGGSLRRVALASLRLCLYLALIFGVNSLLCQGLKGAIDRPRPFVNGEVTLRVTPDTAAHLGQQGSFPSGHATYAFMLAALLADGFRKKRYAFYGLAVLIALSRIYLGVHYPTDVAAGGLMGFATTKLMLSLRHLRCRITGEPLLPSA